MHFGMLHSCNHMRSHARAPHTPVMMSTCIPHAPERECSAQACYALAEARRLAMLLSCRCLRTTKVRTAGLRSSSTSRNGSSQGARAGGAGFITSLCTFKKVKIPSKVQVNRRGTVIGPTNHLSPEEATGGLQLGGTQWCVGAAVGAGQCWSLYLSISLCVRTF